MYSMVEKEEKQLLQDNLEYRGPKYLLNKLVQECAELIVAIQHHVEGRNDGISQICNEISHVQIALNHAYLFLPNATISAEYRKKLKAIQDAIDKGL